MWFMFMLFGLWIVCISGWDYYGIAFGFASVIELAGGGYVDSYMVLCYKLGSIKN